MINYYCFTCIYMHTHISKYRNSAYVMLLVHMFSGPTIRYSLTNLCDLPWRRPFFLTFSLLSCLLGLGVGLRPPDFLLLHLV